jgi:hypothetical protein
MVASSSSGHLQIIQKRGDIPQIVAAALSSALIAVPVQIVAAVLVLVAIATRPQLMSSPSAAVTCQDSLELSIESVACLLLI